MPIVHVYVSEGLLNDAQKTRLFEGLTKAVLRGEAAPDTPNARAVTWIFLHEVKKGTWAVGGVVSNALQILVDIEVPQGALNDRRRARMAAGVGKALDVAGRELLAVESFVEFRE